MNSLTLENKHRFMWVVAKYKSNEYEVFRKNLTETNPNIETYRPGYLKNKKILPLLGTYCFVYDQSFSDMTVLARLKYTKGLNYFLHGCQSHQKSIEEFISFLQSKENKQGLLDPSFFYDYLTKQGTFLSGPLKNMVFDILAQNKKTLTVSIEGSAKSITIHKDKVAVNFL